MCVVSSRERDNGVARLARLEFPDLSVFHGHTCRSAATAEPDMADRACHQGLARPGRFRTQTPTSQRDMILRPEPWAPRNHRVPPRDLLCSLMLSLAFSVPSFVWFQPPSSCSADSWVLVEVLNRLSCKLYYVDTCVFLVLFFFCNIVLEQYCLFGMSGDLAVFCYCFVFIFNFLLSFVCSLAWLYLCPLSTCFDLPWLVSSCLIYCLV